MHSASGNSQSRPNGTRRPCIACSYVLITPARNEAQFIDVAIRSVSSQTQRPTKWVIVSDGSTDCTDDVVSGYVTEFPWIELVRTPYRKERHFAGKVDAFKAGYARLKDVQYDVIGNLDADISFDDTGYFEFLMAKFVENPSLGVCGTSYREGDTIYPSRFTSAEDVVLGACQLFRRECFESIGGYSPIKSGGVDLVAFLSARSKGWETRTFTERTCLHHRPVGSGQHQGVYRKLLETGRKDYLLGSHAVWETFRATYLMKRPPYIIGGVVMLAGYLWEMLRCTERTIPRELIGLRQDDQMRRLKEILRETFLQPRSKGCESKVVQRGRLW